MVGAKAKAPRDPSPSSSEEVDNFGAAMASLLDAIKAGDSSGAGKALKAALIEAELSGD